MTEQPEALFLADELEAPLGTVISGQVDKRAAAELRRLHAENERLGKVCDDFRVLLKVLRAEKQLREAINKAKENT
jgi:hypothetical protein